MGFSYCMMRANDAKLISLDIQLPACQDWDYWIRVLKVTGKRALVIPYAGVVYDNSEHESITSNRDAKIASLDIMINKHYSYYGFYGRCVMRLRKGRIESVKRMISYINRSRATTSTRV